MSLSSISKPAPALGAAMYQPYPGGAQMPEPSRPSAPQSVVRAVQIMYAGAVVSLLGIVVDLTTLSSTKSRIESQHRDYTVTQVNNAEHVAIGIFIVGGLLGAALWLWMAQANKAGKSWARIVATVLFAIDTLSVALGTSAVSSGTAPRIYGLVVWLIGLAAVILLWQRPSSAYFKGTQQY
jgi:hypothetical protein